ncbi:hypothetical protein DL764_001156 [Monosporascus ibericus]|uniref:Rhodopsin domain-containing protein n=1 Tax=Monosporascus ibericus TaxID=155417 RepID=A0A4Q4TT20_9PEZI|nr:hypothetical protein DL764_001156 [Monosporascus ibericus]
MATLTSPDPLPPDVNIGPTLVALSSVLIFLVLLTGSLRLYVRFVQHNAGWDDYLMAVVVPIAVMRFIVQCVQLRYGNGRHRLYIPLDDYVTNNMLGWYAQHMLFLGMCVLKCSIMFLLLRIKNTPTLRWLLGGAMVVLVITSLGCSVILLSECKPISAYWTGEGECWDVRIRFYWIYVTIYVFARVAIWSNLELFLGIIAANLALTRHIYSYFFSRQDLQSNKSTSYCVGSGRIASSHRSNAKYGFFASRLRGDRTENSTTFVATGRRRDSTQSGDSDIPLEPVIQKTTEFWVSEDSPQRDSRANGSRETISPAVSPA